jgi:hypothetical protein
MPPLRCSLSAKFGEIIAKKQRAVDEITAYCAFIKWALQWEIEMVIFLVAALRGALM